MKRTDLSSALNKFADAMYSDPLHVYFFPKAGSRKRKIKALYSFILKNKINSTYISSPRLEGVAVWENPRQIKVKENFSVSIITGMKLIINIGLLTILKMIKYEFWAVRQRKEIMTVPFWYLFVIIVDPVFQGQGCASRLIKPILEEADRNNEKCFLETQNIKNVQIYKKFGFRILIEKNIPHTDLTHYCMVR